MQKIYVFSCVVNQKAYSISLDQQQVQKIIEDQIKSLLSKEMESRYKVRFNGEWTLREKNILG
jgi:hypothetical protein